MCVQLFAELDYERICNPITQMVEEEQFCYFFWPVNF